MNNTSRVILISIMLALFAIIVTFLEPSLKGTEKILYLIFLPIWFFSFIPSFIVSVRWFSSKNDYDRVLISIILKALMIIIPLLIAPILMIVYYYDLFKMKD